MRKTPLILSVGLFVTGCFDKPPFLKSGSASLSQGDDPVTVATIDQDGGTTGLISASAGGAQILTAGSASGVEGSTITFPPGAVAIDTNITITEGEQLATNSDVTSALGLGSDSVSSSGSPVAILSEAKVDAATPFSVALAVPSSAGLRSATTYSHAILFKVFHAFENKYVVGIIPSTEVSVADGFVTFATKYFGIYQVIVTTTPTLTAVVVETREPVKTKAEVDTATSTAKASTSSGTSTTTSTVTNDTPGTDDATDTGEAGDGKDGGDDGETDGQAFPSNVRVISVTAPDANGSYYPGDDLTIEVRFSGPIVIPNGTSLVLRLNSGNGREAVFSTPVAGSDLLSFHYPIGPGDTTSDLDYLDPNALMITAGTPPLDASGLMFSLELPAPGTPGSLGATKAIAIPALPTRSAALASFPSGLSGRAIPAMVFDTTGDRVVIWGGSDGGAGTRGDGAKITSAGVSSLMTTTGAPTARYGMAVTWTGTDMFLWGGGGQGDGARYNPGSDTWTASSATGLTLTPRSWASAVMDAANSRVLVWGGFDTNGNRDDGQVYNLSDDWDDFFAPTPPAARAHHKAVFDTGVSKMFIFGGHTGDLSGSLTGGAKYYHPCGSDCWFASSAINEPTPRVGHVMVSTGSKVIVWGGFNAVSSALADGGIYDPATDTWDPIPVTTGIRGRHDAAAVWDSTNARMIVYGGEDGSHTYDVAMAFNPVDKSWAILDFGPMKIQGSAQAGAAFGNNHAYFFGGSVGIMGNGGTLMDRLFRINL